MQIYLHIGFNCIDYPSKKNRYKWIKLWTFWINPFWLEYTIEDGIKYGKGRY